MTFHEYERPSPGSGQAISATIAAQESSKRKRTLSDPNAANSGTFKIGGDIEVNRLGFGAMRITGRGIWGEPADRAEAIRTLKRLPELGLVM